MSGIKYYRLGNGEEPPDEFCAVRDGNGEPEEYTWYEPMDSFDRELWGIFKESDWVVASEYRKLKAENARLQEVVDDGEIHAREVLAENAKLRELVRDMWNDGMCECDERGACTTCEYGYLDRMRELGIDA